MNKKAEAFNLGLKTTYRIFQPFPCSMKRSNLSR
nr:MAG TPA: hypothetical protein [Caudoviricetes sp.]